MSQDFVRTDTRDGLCTVHLCREPVNVLQVPMMREIRAALDHAEAEAETDADAEARAVLIAG